MKENEKLKKLLAEKELENALLSETLKNDEETINMANTEDLLIIRLDFKRKFTKAVIVQMGINQKMSDQILNDDPKLNRFNLLL